MRIGGSPIIGYECLLHCGKFKTMDLKVSTLTAMGMGMAISITGAGTLALGASGRDTKSSKNRPANISADDHNGGRSNESKAAYNRAPWPFHA